MPPASTSTARWRASRRRCGASTPTPGWSIRGTRQRSIVDAILDSSGPMRYGCDPVSLELLDLWRQCDDETVFTMTGQSLLDQSH